MNRKSAAVGIGLFVAALITLNQNCSKASFDKADNSSSAGASGDNGGLGSSTDPTGNPGGTVDTGTSGGTTPVVVDPYKNDKPDVTALAYGSSDEDREFLASKIAGVNPPSINEIFGQWRRFVNNQTYATVKDAQPDPALAKCYTGFDAAGEWKSFVENGKTIFPGDYGPCYRSPAFTAASWTFLKSPDRLHIGVNASNVNGFLSALPFDSFTSEAIVSSNAKDDDEMGLIIAAVTDSKGILHTLTAARSQGGQGSKLGFGIIYRQGAPAGNIIREVAVGAINPGANGPGDTGWNGRMSKVRVERKGDLISVYASENGTNASSLAVSPQSRLDVDLSDANLGLQIFRGAHYYGFSTISQQSAEFKSIKFTYNTDGLYVYDLMKDQVYKQKTDGSGGYAIIAGRSAVAMLGAPRKVLNPEIQKQYRLTAAKTFTVIAN